MMLNKFGRSFLLTSGQPDLWSAYQTNCVVDRRITWGEAVRVELVRKIGAFLLPAGAACLCVLFWLGLDPRSFVLARGFGSAQIVEPDYQAPLVGLASTRIFINEIHYDNSGADVGEGIEIAGPAGSSLAGWRLALYNGSGGASYASIPLAGIFPDLENGYGCLFFPAAGLQNGAPDGIALVNAHGTVVQFLSYEGVFIATDGPARGYISTDIGAEENGSGDVGTSLQLRGVGRTYEDFAWDRPAPDTFGSVNHAQTFSASGPSGTLEIAKFAPAYVSSGELLTYTLVVQNMLGFALHQLVITDVVPSAASFAYALDQGQEANGVVSWRVDNLASQSSLELRFVVTAPAEPQSLVINEKYAVFAQEWVTPTFGMPVYTTVGEYTPVPLIQGRGNRSPFTGKSVKTRGVVTGFFRGNYPDGSFFNGFFLQDSLGDGSSMSSDGLFVHTGTSNIPVSQGSLVEVSGMVQEFDEIDGAACSGDSCQTQISVTKSANVVTIGAGSVLSTRLDPPGNPQHAAAYFESCEGMLVHLPITATVTGPTSFGTIFVVAGDQAQERVLHGSPWEGMTFGVRNWERSGDIDNQNAPGLITGSVVDNVDGPLAWSYGDYLVITQAGDTWWVVFSRPVPRSVPGWPRPRQDQFSAVTYNTDNLFGLGIQFTKVISTILQTNGPTFLSLQEINPSEVLPSLVDRLGDSGYDYEYAYSHADTGGRSVALLWRTGRVTNVHWSTQYQGCSPNGSPSSTYDPLWDTCRSLGEYPLFARRPVVVSGTLTVSESHLPVVVIANHFKSKLEGESAEQRRLEEAQFVGKLVGDLVANGSTNVIVMGDLNDFEDSPALQALFTYGGLVNPWNNLAQENRYSFIYQGVSQVLDYILITPGLRPWLVAFQPLHLNADFPYSPYARDRYVLWRSSDHDLAAAMFTVAFENRIFLPVVR